MISAELKFRDFVPYGTIAIEFTSIKFFGDSNVTHKLDSLFNLAKFEKYSIYEDEINKCEYTIKDLKKKSEENSKKLEKLKKDNTDWFLHINIVRKIKMLNKENVEIDTNIRSLEEKLSKYKKECHYSASELKYKFMDLLNLLDFTIIGSTNDSKSSVTISNYTYSNESVNALINKINHQTEEIEKRIRNNKDIRQRRMKIEQKGDEIEKLL